MVTRVYLLEFAQDIHLLRAYLLVSAQDHQLKSEKGFRSLDPRGADINPPGVTGRHSTSVPVFSESAIAVSPYLSTDGSGSGQRGCACYDDIRTLMQYRMKDESTHPDGSHC